ncbi:bifunctional metallophosphatase/5'-nucleotidase [Ferdinandcohnia quinoae]|uniref:Bifunctional metallophosphatase/5'-nucleotidase n=1 Tax=Fredinandcohnia quinoae TaxID=2918902 RepID=A0AAW5EDK5_9BACI|nr:bifunctional UDP-sugar hydrolase/5'-nucleotidase [Fredinandcohnia sp. SECRCQ15]MCH1627805.1 bifunctional metallophosphatase/5'-nucleotidase [Fredinandcohnia sp. SECRCQ15]
MNIKRKLKIIMTSDMHGNVLPINYGNNEKQDLGLAKISTLIKNERKENDATIVIDNGDLIQGTPLTYHYVKYMNSLENPMIKILNTLHYDAAVLGNHEFNYGMDVLQSAVEQSNFPWLSGNILDVKDGEPYFGKPYIIKLVDDIKIAILGMTTHYIPNWENPVHIEGLRFEDALETTKKWAGQIREIEKPDIFIVAYHGGFERDLVTGEETEKQTGENQAYQICQQVEGIDVLLTGHQHRSLQGIVNGVAIVQPSFNGQVLGKITLILSKENEKWIIDEKRPELLNVRGIEPDSQVLELVREYEAETQKWLDKPIGKIEGDMTISDPMKIRLADNPLIEFINKVQMEAAGVDISNTALFNNISTGFCSNITMRDIVSNYIYPNILHVIRILGSDIKAALERSAGYFSLNDVGQVVVSQNFVEPKPQHYNYDMWEGIEYIIDIRKPVGGRVITLNYHGKPLDMDKEYDVVMNNYRAGGGGEYTMYQKKPLIKEIQIDMSELLASYILERKTIRATVNHNWKVIW